jgi:menaquinone-dependent protoporphyrinogen oxidase
VSRVLIAYHSHDGQTARIAGWVAELIRRAGHAVVLERFDGKAIRDVESFDGVVVGAAIRYGHHDRAFERAVRRRSAQLAARPNAFFSVCMAAGGPGAKPQLAQGYIDAFLANTAWAPHEAASFAGALRYSSYGFVVKLMMKLIVGHAGGETDSSRDYEYTDWAAVERFARAFTARLAPQARAA